MATRERIDQFFILHSARLDMWREILSQAERWEEQRGTRADVEAPLSRLAVIEEFHAFPGVQVMHELQELLRKDDAKGLVSEVRRISDALLTRGLAREIDGDGASNDDALPSIVPSALSGRDRHRPYFELLFVTHQAPARWSAFAAELRKLRRIEDRFVYEPVMVRSIEDAICAAIVNPRIVACIISDGVPLRSRHEAPVLKELLAPFASALEGEASGVALARVLRRIRPDLDLYLSTDRAVEQLAAQCSEGLVRRLFYAAEEPLELHLAVLEGVQARFETPYFDNLKKYAERPVGTFHALPIARGKSVFRSEWIKDMGEFYGVNLFLAESSATTGGLDSLLEPTGNIKRAQDLAARAFGADQVFFVTNGTSTSNKMVVQALVAPGDIVLVDRNCHKSHHYGLVLGGGLPLYVEAFPLTKYSMYGAVPLSTIKKALLDLRDDGRLERVRMLDLTNCTFDGHMYNTRRVMEECLAIKPDLIFLWDEAWSGFARWSPFLRSRTAMGAAADISDWLADPSSISAYERQQAELGQSPTRERLLTTRLIPDPRSVRLRVYQTNSTHKSMSAIRQGSMVLVKDADFETVKSQFREAVFTHASTSPNLQLIASLDVARRQMELEGYGLVMNAISIALKIRQEVNSNPLISKYFRILGADELIPEQYRQSGFKDYLASGATWADVVKAMREDEFYLDPTRMTLVCGTAGYDGTEFKGLLASRFNIQVNKTSRNSVLVQSNINNTRSDVAHLVRVLMEVSKEVEQRLHAGGDSARAAWASRVKSLMEDVPELPNFSRFSNGYRAQERTRTSEGDMRRAFFAAYEPRNCEYVPILGDECDRRLKDGPEMVSANFVIPYPPGFPIMVPGQVITREAIDFMRKLDVKEIHGYEREKGLKLLRLM